MDADGYLWLNDDVELDSGCAYATPHVVEPYGGRVCRQPLHPRRRDPRLGWRGHLWRPPGRAVTLRPAFRIQEPIEDLKPIDTFNGNIVLVPREVIKEIGINDPSYHHNFGDNDYGLQGKPAGIAVRLLKGTLGVCEANAQKKLLGFGSPHLSFGEQWRKVNTHHGLPFASWWRFTRRHSGLWFPLHFLLPYRKLFGIGLRSKRVR